MVCRMSTWTFRFAHAKQFFNVSVIVVRKSISVLGDEHAFFGRHSARRHLIGSRVSEQIRGDKRHVGSSLEPARVRRVRRALLVADETTDLLHARVRWQAAWCRHTELWALDCPLMVVPAQKMRPTHLKTLAETNKNE